MFCHADYEPFRLIYAVLASFRVFWGPPMGVFFFDFIVLFVAVLMIGNRRRLDLRVFSTVRGIMERNVGKPSGGDPDMPRPRSARRPTPCRPGRSAPRAVMLVIILVQPISAPNPAHDTFTESELNEIYAAAEAVRCVS